MQEKIVQIKSTNTLYVGSSPNVLQVKTPVW